MDDALEIARGLAQRAWGADIGVIEPIVGDASARSYWRVTPDGPGAPPTAILLRTPDSGIALSSEELSTVGDLREPPFLDVQRYLERVGIGVPAIYAAESDGSAILLEDVGPTTLFAAAGNADPATIYGRALDVLVDLQQAGATNPDPSCVAFRGRFDQRLVRWELDHFLEFGLPEGALVGPSRTEVERAFDALAAELAATPTALAHRDYHGWNLHVAEGRVRVIDFQDALIAPRAYDLASLLTDRSTPTRIPPEVERALVEHFRSAAEARSGRAIEADAFAREYRLCTLQRALKVIGRFHYLERVKGKSGYVAMLPDTLATARRAFENLDGLGRLRDRLAEALPELA